ncbi:hypothetical protein TorRG33x02_331780 [Trema orientale]|uniref:Uncharacterized protein n=1 Tax=Trema orientale TaxID=63057 RepID=A0A2P5B5S7_TREOI|nr:hypothetical protein TorRG33x02_331780 [Trema orientale]
MREIVESSSAGSTPPNLDPLSSWNYVLDSLFPKPAAECDLWRNLADDGWCFFSDNQRENSQQYLFDTGRSAASEPLCQKINACPRHSPRPSGSDMPERRKRKQKVDIVEENEREKTAYSTLHPHHLVCPPDFGHRQVN